MIQEAVRMELARIGRRHRWVWEELTFDQKMQECNRLSCAGPKAMVSYLLGVYGSRTELKTALYAHIGDALVGSPGIRGLVQQHSWLLDEAVYASKLAESRVICATVTTMYRYLVSCFGSEPQVHAVLVEHLLRWRGQGRRKTLGIDFVTGA